MSKPASWLVAGSEGQPYFFSSADGAAGVVIDVGSTSILPTTDQIRAAIEQAAHDLSVQLGLPVSVTYQPLTLGSLSGQTGKLIISGSTNTYLISAVGDGQHLVLITQTYHAAATTTDIAEANQLIASLQITGGSSL